MNIDTQKTSILKIIGPGILFAGSAVGVSHLVQSTRAGGMYGLALVVFILLALLAKYPAFFFAPRYAAATGKSLLSSYRRQGKFALTFYGLSTLLTMFIGTAANLLITAGLVKAALGLDIDLFSTALIINAVGMALLMIGHYHWLDLVVKVMVVFLSIATITAAIVAIPMIDFSLSGQLVPSGYQLATVMFIAALVGWMPTPLDVSVWQSQWAVAKMRDSKYRPSLRESRIDFNVGYVMTLLLALCFVILGTAVMHNSGESFAGNPALFAAQVIGFYEQVLGAWSGPLVGLAVMSVMCSTYLTILDGFPRGLANLLLIVQGKEETADEPETTDKQRRTYHWLAMTMMVVGAMVILSYFLNDLGKFIDFATIISFLGAPIYALLNHRAITGPDVPEAARPCTAMRVWSICGMLTMAAFALVYVYLVFVLK